MLVIQLLKRLKMDYYLVGSMKVSRSDLTDRMLFVLLMKCLIAKLFRLIDGKSWTLVVRHDSKGLCPFNELGRPSFTFVICAPPKKWGGATNENVAGACLPLLFLFFLNILKNEYLVFPKYP